MKKVLLLLSVFIFCLFSAQAQNHKKYITYTIKKGETLKKIAKRYELKSRDLKRLNPDVKRRPKPNTVILIPNLNYKEDAVIVTASKIHIVQPKETLYGISKKYNVSIDALKGANPSLRVEGLKIGIALEIPNNKIITPEELEKQKLAKWALDYKLHKVIKDDTLYNLTKKYEISIEELFLLNPLVRSEGLKLGSVIKIKKKVLVETVSANDAKVDSLNIRDVFKDSILENKSFNVAMLLPLKFSKNDTLTKEALFSSKGNLVNIVSDFYLGAKIAIDSLKEQGVHVNLRVFDTENKIDTIKNILKDEYFNTVDVVFGPVYSSNVNIVAAKLKDTPIIYPFYSSKQQKFKYSNTIKTETNRSLYEEKLVEHIESTHTNEHILIIGDGKISSKKKILQLRDRLHINDTINRVEILQPENGYINNERFISVVDTLAVNWVLLTTNSNVVTADVVNSLKALPNNPIVKLFAFEKKDNFTKVDNNTLAKMQFTYASSDVFSPNTNLTERFYEKYLKDNNAYPTKSSTRGFDVVYDILIRMATQEEPFIEKSIGNGYSKRIENTFYYLKPNIQKPTTNNSVHLYRYDENLLIEKME
jgi:LysM repeat protein